MKKLMIIQPYLAPYRIDIYNTLAKQFNLMLVYWYSQAPEQNFDLETLKQKCFFRFVYLKYGFSIKGRVIKFDIINNILKFKPKIIVCHEYGFFTFITLLMSFFLSLKVIINTDDNIDMLQETKGIRKMLRHMFLNRANGVITTNPESLNYIINYFPHLKESSIFFPILQNEIYFRQELNLSLKHSQKYIETYQLSGKKVLLYIGRIAPVKGLDVLINSFRILAESADDVVLVIVGSGPDEMLLKKMVTECKLEKKIILTGRMDGKALYAWYNIGQIFILPSRYEPFGAVVNEALIAGCFAVVSSKVGAKFLIGNGNGLIFKNESTVSLNEKINCFLPKISAINGVCETKNSNSSHNFNYYTSKFSEFLNSL